MARPAVPAAPPPGWGPRPPAATTVALGPAVLDIGHEAAVIGRLRGPLDADSDQPWGGLDGAALAAAAEPLVSAGAAAVELAVPPGADPQRVRSTVAALVERLEVPLLVAASPSAPLEAALASGAVAAVVGPPVPEHHLAAVSALGASLVVPGDGSPQGRRAAHAAGSAALAAGMPLERVLLDVGAAGDARAGVPGLAVVVSDPGDLDHQAGEARADRSAALALGIALGGRLLRTTDAHAARRTSVALAAISQARQERAPA